MRFFVGGAGLRVAHEKTKTGLEGLVVPFCFERGLHGLGVGLWVHEIFGGVLGLVHFYAARPCHFHRERGAALFDVMVFGGGYGQ